MTELSEHLFRRESGRMIATLTRILGVQDLGLAEDVVQDAFCRALEVWKLRGVPENPGAWLMATAKNRALDVLRRERTARTFGPELGRLTGNEAKLASSVEELFAATAIQDDELRMMFSCCHPRRPEEAQVSLVLNILCGFSVDEVAGAFVGTHAATEKRIARAKKTLAQSKRLVNVANAEEFSTRLPAVQRALYLLFNEGYHGASAETAVRAHLCLEAIRLTRLLLEHGFGRKPSTWALAALMCIQGARLPGRVDGSGNLSPLFRQDRLRWDQRLLEEGMEFFELAASGPELTEYHLEAAIACLHTTAPSAEQTDWQTIVTLYDKLMAVRPSPVVALNRAIAIAQRDGPARGLEAIRAIADSGRLERYPFYHAALGELELRGERPDLARAHFASAAALARNAMERRFFEGRMAACGAVFTE